MSLLKHDRILVLGSAVILFALAGVSTTIVRAEDKKADEGKTARPSLMQYLNIRAPRMVQPAPDGAVYFVDRPDGIYQLYRRTAGGGEAEQLTSFDDGIDSFTLSPNGEYLVAVASVGGNEQGQLHLMNTATKDVTMVMENPDVKHGAVLWRDDSRAFAFQANDENSADFHVLVYDVVTKSVTPVVRQSGYNYPAAFTTDAHKLATARYLSNIHSEIFESSAASGATREITPMAAERRFQVVGYDKDGDSLIVTTDYLGDRENIARLNIADRSIDALLPDLAEYEVDAAALSRDRSNLAVVANEGGYSGLHVYSMPNLEEIKLKDVPRGVIGGLEFLEDGSLVFSVSSPQNPGTTFRVNPGDPSKAPQRIAEPFTAGVDTATCVMPELVHITSFDGLEVPAFLYLPAGYKKGTPIPFVLAIHGGPESQYRPRLSSWQQYLIADGFGVLAPNVRGSSGYGRAYQNMDNYKKRLDSVKDALACAEWLIGGKYTTKGQLAVVGGSYGGYMVMACITEAPDLWGAACNIVGVVNFETFLKNTKAYRRKLREAEYGPLSDPEFLKSISPLYKVDQIQAPLLVVHGKNDPRVPVGEAEQVEAALKKLGRPVELMVFDDEGHGVRKLENRIKYEERLVAFLKENLQQGP